jgi:hypothetical protein
VRYLFDENLSEDAARAMNVLVAREATFQHILDFAPQRTDDAQIPRICHEHGFDVVFTANVRDFGARKVIFEALLASHVHVLVLRPGRVALTVFMQTSLIARHYLSYNKLLEESSGPVLASITESGVRTVTLTELLQKVEERKRLP